MEKYEIEILLFHRILSTYFQFNDESRENIAEIRRKEIAWHIERWLLITVIVWGLLGKLRASTDLRWFEAQRHITNICQIQIGIAFFFLSLPLCLSLSFRIVSSFLLAYSCSLSSDTRIHSVGFLFEILSSTHFQMYIETNRLLVVWFRFISFSEYDEKPELDTGVFPGL